MATFDSSKSLTAVELASFAYALQAPDTTNLGVSFTNTSSTGYTYTQGNSSNNVAKIGGTGIAYGAFSRPSAGTISSISLTFNNNGIANNYINITGASLSVADLNAATNGFVPSLFAGNDMIVGSAFNDFLYGGAGNDTINGGAGIDTVQYSSGYSPVGQPMNGVTVDLVLGTGKTTVVVGGVTTIETDTLISIENVMGCDAQDAALVGQIGRGGDALYGNAGANTLWGMGGNDLLDGRDGSDILNGGMGDDDIRGGNGIDTADYSILTSFAPTGLQGAIVDLAAGQSWGAFGHDVLSSIENVNGSNGNDWISGTIGVNALFGGAGDDVIYGLGGDDSLDGGAGRDSLYGGTGNDIIRSDIGSDYVEGGDGNDTLIDASGFFVQGEWSALHGGNGNDTIQATGLSDIGMWGDAGADTFLFGAGKTFAYGGSGADIFSFGADALRTSGSSLAQIFDYELGIDKIRANGTVAVADWGANTGVLITTSTGTLETIMLMGVTATQLNATSWLTA
jgi:Ca2+-binding RTX toxin-like protein